MKLLSKGFTLIELLVVISIIGILIGLSIFGLQGARTASRDAKRKTDLEQIRSGLEIYKSDCAKYPSGSGNATTVLANSSNSLVGDGSSSSCSSSNTYISQIPTDPISPNSYYVYFSDGITYQICSALEQGPAGSVSCGTTSSCGNSSCNYKVTSP